MASLAAIPPTRSFVSPVAMAWSMFERGINVRWKVMGTLVAAAAMAACSVR